MAKRELSVKEWEEMQKWENVDVPALALTTVKAVLVRRPAVTAAWAIGLLIALFAGGLPVDEAAQEAYSLMLQHAEVVDSRELGRSEAELQSLEARYYATRGWFGACDSNCTEAFDRVEMARMEVARARSKRDQALSEARQEVGIWSTYGVQDVRRSFWSAMQSGKDFAARCTMYDALFLWAGKEESAASMVLKLVLQYVINLTMGLIGAFFYFGYNVYVLVVSYGSSALSGLAFLSLALVAGLAMVGTYLGLMYGAVVGGGLMMVQHAAKQAALQAGEQRRQLQDLKAPRQPRCPV